MNASATLETAGWEKQESGWWTHPDHGGITREKESQWMAHPKEEGKEPIGPFPTATEAANHFN